MSAGLRPGTLLAGLLLASMNGGGLRAAPAKPPLPQSTPEHRDADPATCRSESIRRTYQSQLTPWQDQPAAVLSQLKNLQAEMTIATLRRCVQRGLMPRQEALQLARELELIPPTRP